MRWIFDDSGFHADDWRHAFTPLSHLDEVAKNPPAVLAIDLPPDAGIEDLRACLDGVDMVRINFGAFTDGRGFSLARLLRMLGYHGRVRAGGTLLADQYAMIRRCGFDEVELPHGPPPEHARAPWLARADWRAGDFQARLQGMTE